MNPQYEEHLRDSAPDNSRFDGFDRGDSGRPEDPGHDDFAHDIETRAVQLPRDAAKPSTAFRIFAPFQQHHNLKRNDERFQCRTLGKRQYRRRTRASYALKRVALSDRA